MPRLDFYSGFKLFVKVRLGETHILIGRGSDCDIQLPSDRVSRHHARIDRRADGDYWIENVSPNGTRVNHAMLEGPQQLHGGDRIYVEDYVVIYQPDEVESVELEKRKTVVMRPLSPPTDTGRIR